MRGAAGAPGVAAAPCSRRGRTRRCTGCAGTTFSTGEAALSAMRRPPRLGQVSFRAARARSSSSARTCASKPRAGSPRPSDELDEDPRAASSLGARLGQGISARTLVRPTIRVRDPERLSIDIGTPEYHASSGPPGRFRSQRSAVEPKTASPAPRHRVRPRLLDVPTPRCTRT